MISELAGGLHGLAAIAAALLSAPAAALIFYVAWKTTK